VTIVLDVIDTLPPDEMTGGLIVTGPVLVRSMSPAALTIPPLSVASDADASMPTVVAALIAPPTATVDPPIVTLLPVDTIASPVVTEPVVAIDTMPPAISGEPAS
jgi:hypothetical protein